jgi:tRNA(Ile)-lysidine synthase
MRLVSYLPLFSPDIPLVRPLLRVSKTEILDYCRERNLEPFSDETNRDTSLLRNRIRLELLPYLETYNPRLKMFCCAPPRFLEANMSLFNPLFHRLGGRSSPQKPQELSSYGGWSS